MRRAHVVLGAGCCLLLFLVSALVGAEVPGSAGSALSGGDLEHSQWWKFLARFHSVLLHFPIGFIALAFLIELVSIFGIPPERARLVTFILVLSSLSSAVVASMGFMLSTEGGYEETTLFWHKWLGFGVVAFAFATTAAQIRARRRAPHIGPRLAYWGLLTSMILLITITGHHGGNLTHGSEYLVKYAPSFVKNLVAAAEPSPMESQAAAGDGYFARAIQPILARKCISCHGPEKQKGDFRVDDTATLLRGGESGEAAIVSGEPLKSNLVRLVLLPPDDEDVMPPKGKESLTGDEIVEIARWIRKGAHFDANETVTPGASAPGAVAGEAPARAQASVVPAVAESVGEPAPASAKQAGGGSSPVDFVKDIKPLFEAKCMECHSSEKHKGKFEIQTREAAVRGGKKHGAGIAAGRPEASSVYLRISASPDEDDVMPSSKDGGPLSPNEIDLVKRWIQEGARWPDGVALSLKPKTE